MQNANKINLVCVGSVGENFFQFLENEKGSIKNFKTAFLNCSEKIDNLKDIRSSDFDDLVFCVLGAASTKNVLKVKSLLDLNPVLWHTTHFILVHPFYFEGEEKALKAKEFSQFVTNQRAKKTDLRNQDLFKFINDKTKFEDGFRIMNKWIFSIIENERS